MRFFTFTSSYQDKGKRKRKKEEAMSFFDYSPTDIGKKEEQRNIQFPSATLNIHIEIIKFNDFCQNLQRSLRTSDEELKDTRQDQHKMAGDYNRINLQTDVSHIL